MNTEISYDSKIGFVGTTTWEQYTKHRPCPKCRSENTKKGPNEQGRYVCPDCGTHSTLKQLRGEV